MSGVHDRLNTDADADADAKSVCQVGSQIVYVNQKNQRVRMSKSKWKPNSSSSSQKIRTTDIRSNSQLSLLHGNGRQINAETLKHIRK